MYLAEVEPRPDLAEPRALHACRGKWDDFPVSTFSHHGSACCDAAMEWLGAMDFALLNGAGLTSGPRWIRDRFKWGPSAWPMHWCEAVREKTLDCGAHAALAQRAFEARGETSFRAQFIQKYNRDAAEQWRAIWDSDGASSHWIDGDRIYHEGNAVLVDADRVKLWDGSAGSWVKPGRVGGYGSLLSVRIFREASGAQLGPLRWEGHPIAFDRWNPVGVETAAIGHGG
jgi:hypothetical protein